MTDCHDGRDSVAHAWLVMSTRSEAEIILARWAAVEHDLELAKGELPTLARDSEEASSLRVEIDRLIEQWASLWLRYQHVAEQAKAENGAKLPAWPDPAS